MEDATQIPIADSTVVEAPVGIFEAKCDDKGRLKLPVRFAMVLKRAEVARVFITTIDLQSARIYTENAWESNRKLLDNPGEDTEDAEDIGLIADTYGDFSTMDEHGRVLIPTTLRRELGIEKQAVFLQHWREHIKVIPKALHEARMARARVDLLDKAKRFEKKGFR